MKSVFFAKKNCSFLSVKMVYSSLEPQFVCVATILKKEKITPQRLGREVVDDFLYGKSSSVAILNPSHRGFGTKGPYNSLEPWPFTLPF